MNISETGLPQRESRSSAGDFNRQILEHHPQSQKGEIVTDRVGGFMGHPPQRHGTVNDKRQPSEASNTSSGFERRWFSATSHLYRTCAHGWHVRVVASRAPPPLPFSTCFSSVSNLEAQTRRVGCFFTNIAAVGLTIFSTASAKQASESR